MDQAVRSTNGASAEAIRCSFTICHHPTSLANGKSLLCAGLSCKKGVCARPSSLDVAVIWWHRLNWFREVVCCYEFFTHLITYHLVIVWKWLTHWIFISTSDSNEPLCFGNCLCLAVWLNQTKWKFASWTSRAPAALSQLLRSTSQVRLGFGCLAPNTSPTKCLNIVCNFSYYLLYLVLNAHIPLYIPTNQASSCPASNQASKRPQASHAKFTAAEPKIRMVLKVPGVWPRCWGVICLMAVFQTRHCTSRSGAPKGLHGAHLV